MLDCCEPLDKVKAQGITFGKVACLAHCSGADVENLPTLQAGITVSRK
jgi:glutathione gamma-glutamylcysteinyltransferase